MVYQQIPYSSLNARYLSSEQVAESFVPSDHFYQLLGREHTFLLGPRGSGKTTLLKMLSQKALAAWNYPESSELRQKIPFNTVYIPIDIHLYRQILRIEEDLYRCPGFAELASGAIISTCALNAVCDAIDERVDCEFPFARLPDMEAALCEQLASTWFLNSSAADLSAIRLGLRFRISQIEMEIKRAVYCELTDEELSELPEYFYLDFMTSVSSACKLFDTVFPSQEPKQWAVCVDELGFAPEWLKNRLIAETRNAGQAMIFKLAASPAPGFSESPAGSPKACRVIHLWPTGQDCAYRFCDRLARSTIERRLGASIEPEKLFGHSYLAGEVRHNAADKGYEPGGEVFEAVRSLAERDQSLLTLLVSKNISPENPSPKDSGQGAFLKKIGASAVLRSALADPEAGSMPDTTNKIGPYWGVETIYATSEGNPRILLSILEALMEMVAINETNTFQPVPTRVQARILSEISARMSDSMLGTPGTSNAEVKNHSGLWEIFQATAFVVSEEIRSAIFNADYSGIIKLDAPLSEKISTCIRAGLQAGVLIQVNPGEKLLDSDLSDGQVRFSYMLSPKWGLPLRYTGITPLTDLLGHTRYISDDDTHNSGMEYRK